MQASLPVTAEPSLSTLSTVHDFHASTSHGATQTTPELPFNREALLHFTFPSQEDTLAYVDALKHSDLSQWRSLEEVAARAGRGSCSGTMSTSVLTALYLLGLFHLCTTSPTSCCIPPAPSRRKRHAADPLPPVLEALQHNASTAKSTSERWPPHHRGLPPLYSPEGGVVPVHLGVVEQVRQLWNSNPRLLSNVPCRNPTESVRSSFISLSGVASGIILAYSVAQLKQCHPNLSSSAPDTTPNIWFFPLPKPEDKAERKFLVPSLPSVIPVPGEDDPSDGCERSEVVLEDGRCAPLLSTLHCPYQHWVLLNRDTRKGECVPRLCGEGRVYVERDQLCHDVNERGICAESQRLFLDAFGRSVCDCPDGMYQGPGGQCYILYDPAYCAQGTVFQFHQASKTLMCGNDPCGHVNSNLWPDDLPFAPREDGFCYQFNEQGPCEAGERFGFNTETLRAECVSLFEAGMLRPKRSYLYSQMSYPSSPNHPSQHYQVSYVVVNGSTWGLEVKGVDRERRRPREVKDEDSTVKKLPFIDTWSIPSKLEAVLSHLYSSEDNATSNETTNCLEHDDEFDDYEDCEFTLEGDTYDDDRPDGYLNDPKYLIEARESQFTNTWDNPLGAAKVTNSLPGEIISNEVTLDQYVTTPLSEKLKKKQLVQALMKFSNESELSTLTHISSLKNSSELSILNPTLNADALFAPVEVASFTENPENHSLPLSSTSYFHDPSTAESIIKRLLTPRLRIIDTLSHPRREKIEQKFSHSASFNNRLLNISTSLDDRKRNSLHYNLDQVLPEVSAGEVLKVNQDEKQITTQLEPAVPTSTPSDVSLTSPADVIKVDQSEPATLEYATDTTVVDRSSTLSTMRATTTDTATTRRRGDITVVTRRSHRRPHRRRRNRRRKFNRRKHRTDSQKDKNRKRHNRRKNPNLPVKVPVSASVEQATVSADQLTSTPRLRQTTLELPSSLELPSPVALETTTQEHTTTSPVPESTVPHLDIVPTEFDSSTLSTSLVTKKQRSRATSSPPKKSKRPNHTSRRNRLRNRHRNSTSRRPGRRRPSLSLTDQRHRDRRQLTAGGGIIQAPLLSACKPGAKRDYNYKCRPKFIPQEKNTESSDKKESAVPVPPRIKCPKGTHLDPRGKCQAISNILG